MIFDSVFASTILQPKGFSRHRCCLAVWVLMAWVMLLTLPRDVQAQSNEAVEQTITQLGKVPLAFEPNVGQTDDHVSYLSRGEGYTLFLTDNGAVLSLKNAESTSVGDVVRLHFVGANPDPKVVALDRQEGVSNYFLGNDPKKWQSNVPHMSRVRYDNIYPGIDLVYYGTNQRQLEYDFVVAPGVDPDVIRLQFEGADQLRLDGEGNLIVHTLGGDVVLKAPVTYQNIDGVRVDVESRFVLSSDLIAFDLGVYDSNYVLTIDPVLSYSSYFGGSGSEEQPYLTLDTSGNIYVAGGTAATNFPTLNPIQASKAGSGDVGITKLSSDGASIIYSTYLGGTALDKVHDVAVDASGNFYVTGFTFSTDFPTQSPLQASYGGGSQDGFLVKVNPAGSGLVYSTYVGGNNVDRGIGVDADASGNAYLAGFTASSDFTTVNPIQASLGGGQDLFVAKYNAAGSALTYATYLGGSSQETDGKIVVDASGNAYVVGQSSSSNFPTQSPYQAARAGGSDAVVFKVNAAGSALTFSTYLGGSGTEQDMNIDIDSSGNVYVAGKTNSTDFPTQSAYQAANAGGYDGFVTKFNSAGSALTYSTYIGGAGDEAIWDLDVDSSGQVAIGGETSATGYPTVSPHQSAYGGGLNDGVISKFNAAGSALTYSTYLGGSGNRDQVIGVVHDALNNIVFSGWTVSTDFPTVNPYQASNRGGNDWYIAKISSIIESKITVGLSGATTGVAGSEVQILTTGVTGDGSASVSSVALTLSDLSSATGLASSDFTELRLYRSTDATLGGDTQIGSQSTVNIGSTTTVSATSANVPPSGTRVYYIVSAVLSGSAVKNHAFRVGFSAGGMTTSLGSMGSVVTASDANKVTLSNIDVTTAGSGLSGSALVLPSSEKQIFSIGMTGDGVAKVNSVAVTVSDSSTVTGLSSSDFSSLKLYRSTDATLDGSDTQIGTQTTVNVGSVTTISDTSTFVPSNGSEVFYLVSATLSASAVSGHVYRVGFATGGVITTAGTKGSAVTASDANRVRIAGLTESVTASGLSGVSTVLPSSETKVFGIGMTGDGVAGMSSVTVTVSDSSTSTGLVSGDFSSLKLYRSTDAVLDGSDSLMATQSTVNVGSATTLTPASTHIPSVSTQVYYLVSATLSSSATSGRVFRLGFASGGVSTNATAKGTAVTASDASRVRIAGLTESVTATGLSGVSTVLPSSETKVFSIGLTGDGVAGVSSIAVTISDSSTSTGLVSGDFSSLKLYRSTDAVLDGSDSLMATQTTVNVGSGTTLSPVSTHILPSGTQVYYLVSATLSSSATSGRVFRLGFASGGVTTNATAKGTAVTVSDANRVRVAGLTESVTSSGLSGASTVLVGAETKVFGIGLTGDGVSGVNSVTVTLSDLSGATGLASSDISSLKLYASSDVTLDGSDTLLGTQNTVNVGSATTVSASSTNIPSAGSLVYYLVSATLSSSAVDGHAFKVGFASGGVTTNASAVGSAVSASDVNKVTVGGVTSGSVAGLSGGTIVLPGHEVQVFRYGMTGNGVTGVNSIAVTLSDLSGATGLTSGDISSLKLYSSSDTTLDGSDTLLGSQNSVTVGSATTVSASSTNIPSSGSQVYYLVSATLSNSAVSGHALKVGFASGGVSTNAGTDGSVVSANDANKVTVAGLTESVSATGLSGITTVLPGTETKVFGIGLTGDGVAGVSSVTVTISDSSTSTGLSSSDFASLKLYRSLDAVLDGSDSLMATQSTVNVGSVTTLTPGSTHIVPSSTQVYYLVSATLSSGATSGRVYRLGFATGGVTTNASAAGSAVVVSDANRVRVAGLTESVTASGLSGVTTVLPSSETKVFGIGVTGDGVAGVNSVTVTLSDSSTSTGLVSTDVDSLKLYVSADATLSSDDTLIGSQTTVNIGSATTISATSAHIPSASSTVYYLIGVKLSSSAVRGHVLRLGFASGGVTTNASSVGTTVTASDANRLRVAGLTESVVATGLSGVSTILPGKETKVFGVGFTGDGVAGVKSVTVTVSDSSTSSGLVSSDFDSLKLYVSSDATLSSDDTLIGSLATVNVGSATTISATSTHIPSASSTVYYLIGAKLSSSAVSGHVFRLGFAAGGVTTNASAVGTAVTASDANRVRVAGLGSGAIATGLSGASTVFPGAEVQIFRYGLVGDGVAGLNSVTLTLSDLSTSTGMSSTDVDSLKLYHSTDVTLDSGDTLIGSQTTVNVGSATTISTTLTDIPTSGTTRYYLVSAKLSASAVGDHAFKVGFASGGVSTNAGTSGTAVTANDANKVTVTGITETTVASGLSGEVKVVPKQESQIFQVGLTGNGVAGLNGVTLTLSDLSTATGLVSGDVDSLKLYRSANAILDSSDTLIGVQTSVNVGSATTVSATTADILSGTTEQFYLVSVVMGSAAIGNHAFKVGFASAGVGTALGGRGSAIAALDSNVVRVLLPPTLVRFGGISMNTATPTLDWVDVVGAVSYVLEVSDRSNFVSVNRVSGLTKSQYTLPSALEDGSYFWRVSAVTSVGATQFSLPDVFVVASKRSDPQGVAVRIAAPQKGQIVGIGDTVLVQVLAYRALSVLDTVIVGLSTSTATELFGNVGIIDTLTTVTSVGASVDTFSFPLVVKAGTIETQGLGVVAQARVSVKKDGLPLKGIDNQSGLPVIGDLPDFGFVGDSVKVGVDGQRPLNIGFFQMAMIDTTTLPNTGGRVFGVRTTSDGAANNQQLIRSFKTGDDVTLRLKAGNIGAGGAVSARLYVVDAVTPGYPVPDSSLYSAKIDLGDLLRASGDLRVTFKAAEGQFQHASVKQNMRVKVLGYVVDGAGNLSANTTGAVTPQGYEQDIWVVADTQTPVVHMTHPAKEGERFTGRVDTSVVYRKDDGALDTAFKIDLKPLQFGVNEATMARWAIVGTDTAHYGGVSDTTGLKVTTRDSFALTTRPVAGQKIDLSVVVKDSVGNKGVAKISNVVLDEVAPTISGLFPSSRRLPKGNPTFNPTMLSPTFLANEGLDSISVRYVQIGGSQIATSNVATVTKDGITVSVSDSLMDASQYTLQVFVRDLAGNVQVSALDTLVYESTIENPKADSFAVVIDSTITVVDSVIAGVNLPLQVTAWDTKVPTAALVALTYNKVGVLVRAVAPGQDVSGVSFGGVGVVDHGNGTATLNGEGWVAGSRIVLVKSVRTLDDFSVVVADTNWVTDSVFVNFEGRLSGLTVDAGAFDHYAVMAKENGQETQVVSGAFDLWVQPTDAYGNPSNKVFVGAVDLRSADSLKASTNLLDTRIPLGNVKGSTWVMFSANVGDVSLPQGAQEILQTGRLLSGVAPSREGDGLVIRVRVANEKGDSVGVSVGQSVPLAYVMSEAVVEDAIALADPVAPANVIVQDFLGPDGTGDQGRYVMVSFGHTQAQARVGHYRVYREVLIQSALNESGEVVILETPELQFVPWAVIEVPVGGPVPQVIQAVVPALDNVATRWAIAGEWGGESIEGGPLGKRVFPKAQVEQVMQVLGVTTELIEQAIDLDLREETDFVLANLDIDVGAWQKDVPVNVRTKSGHLKTTDRVVSEAVRAVDNLAPQGVLDVFATVSDDETEVRLAWQPSVDDRTVGAVYYRGYSVPIPGVERYEVLRGDKVETLIPVAILPAKSRAFRAPFVTGSVYRIDVLDLDNRTMGEPFRVDRAGPTLAVGVDTVRAGESTTVAISIGRSKGMAGGTIKLLYDASVMTAEAVVGGDITSGMLVLGRLDVPGEITLSLAGASGVQVDEGVLAQVQFSARAQAVGDYALTLASVELRDEVGDVMVLSGRRNGLLSILSNQVQVLVSDVSVDAGKTVVVPVQVENAMGLAGGAWSMMYDANVMTAVRVDAGAEALASGMLVFGRTDVAGQVQITVAGVQGLVLGVGELAQVVFEVHSDVPDGLYDVVMQDVSLRNALGGAMAVAQGQTGWVTVPEGGAGVRVHGGEVIALLGERDVRIDVRVDRAVGVAGGELVLRYDASALTATGVEPGALALSSGMLVLGRTDVPGEVRVTLAGALAVAEVSGVLLGVRFDVKASAVAGEYPLEVVRADFRSASGGVMGTGLITQGRVRIPARDAGVGMYVTNVTSSAGGVVDVGVGVDRAVALAGGEVKLVYDPKNLTARSVRAGASATGLLVLGRTDVPGDVRIVFAGGSGLGQATGELAVVTFEVANSTLDGVYDVRLVSTDLLDGSGNPLLVSERVPGTVTVIPTADFNGDGNLTASDVTLFAQHLGKQTTETDFDRRFDINRDGYVSFQDFIAFVEAFAEKQSKTTEVNDETRTKIYQNETEQSQ